ncbi:MAG: hypothetical protein NT154_00935, partial [Verrucomicrobia bacterium]|nr:hypothetical protein [Verrucomicrobiota bacterium]
GLPTGTLITNMATIFFDRNEPIPTPTVTNTVDGVAPTSTVSALPTLTLTTALTVCWSGKDDSGGSGVGQYEISVSESNGTPVVWIPATTNTSAQFQGQPGHTYGFYSRAYDNAGNREAAHTSPDAQTLVSGNAPPNVSPLTDQYVRVGEAMLVTNRVLSLDRPGEQFIWELLYPPSGAGVQLLDNRSAQIRWTPRASQAGSTNILQVVVTDNGTPSLSVTQAFAVIVADNMEVSLGAAGFTAGQSGCLPINLYSSIAVTNIQLTLSVPPQGLGNFGLHVLSPKLCLGNLQSLSPTQLVVTLQTCAGQSLQGVQPPVAELCFTVDAGLSTTLLPVGVEQATARTTTGAVLTSPGQTSTQVAIIGRESLLLAGIAGDGTRTLTLVGRPGTTYAIEYTTNLAAPALWIRLPYRVLLSTVTTNVPGVTPPPNPVFYRAVEIGSEEVPPTLEMLLQPDGSRILILHGTPGNTYLIQYAAVLSTPMNWSNVVQVTLTGGATTAQIPLPGGGGGFYRAVKVTNTQPVLAALLNPNHTGTITVRGQAASQYTVEYNTNLYKLSDWYPLFDFTLTNETGYFTVTNFADHIFYRLRQK